MGVDVVWVVGDGLVEVVVLDEFKPAFVMEVVLVDVGQSAFVEVGLCVSDEH